VFFLGKLTRRARAGPTIVFVPIQQMGRVSLRNVRCQNPLAKVITRTKFRSTSRPSRLPTFPTGTGVIVSRNRLQCDSQISQTQCAMWVGPSASISCSRDTRGSNDQIKDVTIATRAVGPQGRRSRSRTLRSRQPANAPCQGSRGRATTGAQNRGAEGAISGRGEARPAADTFTQHPVALQLRTLQTMAGKSRSREEN